MKIDLGKLAVGEERFETVFDPSELDLSAEDIKLGGPVTVSGRAAGGEAGYKTTGRIKLAGTRACTRCLTDIPTELDFEFAADFTPASDDGPVEVEVALDDLDESVLSEDAIDLAEVVREQILLELPDWPLCREDCKGLCSKCGADKNLIDCSCSESEVDPRWEALRTLK